MNREIGEMSYGELAARAMDIAPGTQAIVLKKPPPWCRG